MSYLGDFLATQTVTCRFTTENATGAPITFAGSPAVRVRKGTGSGSTITAGITLTVDVLTGQHCADIDLTGSASYTAGADYAIEVSSGTVDGVSVVGKVIGSFSIGSRSVAVTSAGAPSDSSGVTTLLARVSPIATKTGAVVADGGNSATVFVTDLTESTNDYWKDAFIRLTSGVLIDQVKKITGYNGTTKAITTAGFTGTPAAGVTFEIVND